MVNKEIFGMIVFFVSIVTLISVVISTGVTVQNSNNILLVQNATSGVVNPSRDALCTIANTTNNVITPIAQTGSTPFLNAWGYLNFIDVPILNFINGVTHFGSPNTAAQCSTTASDTIFGAVSNIPNTNLNGVKNITQLVAECIVVSSIFIGLGLLAGVLGAGSLAPIVASIGIGLSIIYFMQSVLTSQYFAGIPTFAQVFIDGLTGAMFVWIVIVLLRD